MHCYVKLNLALFKSFASAGHTYEEFVLLFFSPLSITVSAQDIIRLGLSEKMNKDFKVSKFHERILLKYVLFSTFDKQKLGLIFLFQS